MTSKQRVLHEDNELFNDIVEEDIVFPMFFKNRYGTRYTMFTADEKFECISINRKEESFMGCIHFGFDETIHHVDNDRKIWYYLLKRNQVQIEKEEYETAFNILMEGREEFASGDKYKYINLPLPTERKVKHTWKSLNESL